MKVLERLLLGHLNRQVKTFQDPLQFAYRPGVVKEDAIIYLVQWAHSYLAKAGSAVRIMFFDFSSAFNIIQPALLCKKAPQGGCPLNHLDYWQPDKETTVCETEELWSAAQEYHRGLCSSHFLSLCTPQTSSITQSHLQKYSADGGHISDGQEAEYWELVDHFVA